MKKAICILLLLLLAACGSGPEQLFETAELELLQTNYPHATKLYTEIIEKYPDSTQAKTARQRLAEIEARLKEKAAGN